MSPPVRHAFVRLLCTLLLCTLGLTVADRVRAQPLESARAAYDRGDLPAARAAYEAVLENPERALEETVEVHLRLGILDASRGDLESARQRFRVALALDPDLAVPSELPPTPAGVFLEEARNAFPLALTIEPASDGRDELTVRLAHVPEALELRLRVDGGAAREAPPGVHVLRVPVSEGGAIEAFALDRHGAVVARAEWPEGTAGVPSPADVARRDASGTAAAPLSDEGSSLAGEPWFWVAVGGGVLVVATVIAVVISSSASEPGFGTP